MPPSCADGGEESTPTEIHGARSLRKAAQHGVDYSARPTRMPAHAYVLGAAIGKLAHDSDGAGSVPLPTPRQDDSTTPRSRLSTLPCLPIPFPSTDFLAFPLQATTVSLLPQLFSIALLIHYLFFQNMTKKRYDLILNVLTVSIT